MNKQEFEQFVMRDGKDILRFCRMNAGDTERGNELYQDTMLMLLEKRNQLNAEQNVKSYALYTAILLWKNKKKKYAVRNRILPMSSLEEHVEQGEQFPSGEAEKSPEQQVLNQAEIEEIQMAFFEVVDKEKGDSTIIDSSVYEGAPSSFVTVEETEKGKSMTLYAVGEATEEDREARVNQKALSSYTVAYDKQISDNTVINICGDSVLTEKEIKALYRSADPQEQAFLKLQLK